MRSIRWILFVFISVFLVGCATIQEKQVQEIDTLPVILEVHSSFKTFVIQRPIDKVRAVVVKIAREEDFDQIIAHGDTIKVRGRRVIIDQNGLINYAGKTAGVMTAGMGLGVAILAFGFSGGSAAALPSIMVHTAPAMLLGSGLFDASDNKVMTSVNGIAKLSSINDGKATEIKLNFIKLFYSKTFSFNPFADDNYVPTRVEVVDDPEIYVFAFKRLQGINAEFPTPQ